MNEQPEFTPCPACGMPCGPGIGGTTRMPDDTWVRHCLGCPPRAFTPSEKAAHDKFDFIAAGFERAVRRMVAVEGALERAATYLGERCGCGVYVACHKCRAWKDARDVLADRSHLPPPPPTQTPEGL